jgi:hypothetical protein
MRALIHIGLDAWIIQDGNYREFETGGEYRFALEFYPHQIAASDGQPAGRLLHITDALHDVIGTILFCSESVWVVDFGVPAFQESKPPAWARVGASVVGRVYIGVDPFFYFERLKDEPGMPDLFRWWVIRRIQLETTPWKESTDDQGRKVRRRDETRESYVDVPATEAWNHDGGYGHYVLECELSSERLA